MKKYGLIGHPLENSFSRTYFSNKFAKENIQASYQNFEMISLDSLQEVIQINQLDGLNVTHPFKEKIIPFLHQLDYTASLVGAVNCVRIRDGIYCGYNTDVIGFEKSVTPFFLPSTQALVFGTGGASKAIRFVLKKNNIPFLIVSREKNKNAIQYEEINANIANNYKLWINTTPIGMPPLEQIVLPLPYTLLNDSFVAYDLIYNPAKSLFLENCEKHGTIIKNGFEMLCLQADESYTIFTS